MTVPISSVFMHSDNFAFTFHSLCSVLLQYRVKLTDPPTPCTLTLADSYTVRQIRFVITIDDKVTGSDIH